MSTRNRVFLGILMIYVLGVAFLLYRIIDDLDLRYRESAEESLVETSHLLASLIEREVRDGALRVETLGPAFQALYARPVDARIYALHKTRVELRVYVTDARGRVVFDSLGRDTGADYSHWRDVRLALAGQYGARSTRDIEDDPRTSVMYVAAPIYAQGAIIGAVTVGKPVQSFGQFVVAARRNILAIGVGSVVAVVVLAVIVSVWLVRPFAFFGEYVRYVRAQRSLNPLRLWRRALRLIAGAYQEMRDTLAGRHYASEYVQALTHEIKSPLSAIRGAAELLQEPMPRPERERFIANISRESRRIQELVDRLLALSALETRHRLERVETVDLRGLVAQALQAAEPAASRRRVALACAAGGTVKVEGDAFLLTCALSNLLENAIDFSPEGGTVEVGLHLASHRTVEVSVRDRGPGVPEYALDKVFEKFYSLARPHSGKKGTGLGLAFVAEVAELHRGRVSLTNAPGGGAIARLELPRD
ncbi:histidine kinase [Sulfurifustis variabilis]|uniref:histidine kinase n=1 Tax=Sulfurifustis variabilis TaxID=1675686 RepID=A0A1B4VBX8_9GAMM|nr:two-component system sensor histidine kinase CreC [Sulfurifustis variabilis]BAU50244.1 histidine kinase [Sulfurifustis variabilis]